MEPRPLPLPSVADLLGTAEARLRRQHAYARPLSGRQARARQLEAGLARARAALAAVLAPGALWRPVPAAPAGAATQLPLAQRGAAPPEGDRRAPAAALRPADAVAAAMVRLGGVAVPAPRLVEELGQGASACLWLCSLGLDEAALKAALQGDALLTHLAGDLAVQALHAASRAAHAGLVAGHPGQRVLRVALRAPGAARWDAAAVARLLPLFGPAPLGVSRIGDGGFRPAHTLLGVCALRPTG